MKIKFSRIPVCLIIAGASLGLAPVASAASDGVYPLTENSFSNPEFKKRFLGSYGFDMEINPKITSEESEKLKEVAEFMASNPKQAISLLEAFITPETSAALDYTVGSLYLQEGDIAKAKEMYNVAIKKFPNFYRAYQNLGFTLVKEGAYSDAAPMLTEAIEIGGGNGTLWGLLGYCFLNTGKSSLALDAYRQALLFQPDSKDWKLGKLNSLLDTGLNSEAVGMLSDIIEEDPSQANFWMMQANAFMSQQEYAKALANLELVSRMGKSSGPSSVLLGDLFLNEGLAGIAVEKYGDAISSGKVPVSKLLNIAENVAVRGSVSESVKMLDLIESKFGDTLSPDNQLAILNLKASAAISLGEMEKAAGLLEEVVSKDPMNGKALISLGDYYRNKGDAENAMIQYERASKVGDVEATALISLARMQVSMHDYRSAVTNLKRANTLEPKAYLEDYIARLETALKSM